MVCLIHHRTSVKPRLTTVAEAGTVIILKGNVPGVTMANVNELQYFGEKKMILVVVFYFAVVFFILSLI